MLGLDEHHQAAFVGVRSTFYRIASISGQGVLVIVAGSLETTTGDVHVAWSLTFGILSTVVGGLFLYHLYVLPRPAADHAVRARKPPFQEFIDTFVLFFKKPGIIATLSFLLLYRFAEAQLVKLASPFLLDAREVGGLGLSTSDVGVAYGTVGIVALTLGGLLGGYVASRVGLKAVLWPMVLSINVPDLIYVYLAHAQPGDLTIINAGVAIEQFGYGFGFTAFLLYMIMVSDGEHKTAHYAICTGIMALGMMIPGMFSGALQEYLGYKQFFWWVMIATAPGFIVTALLKIDPGFGRKKSS
jgi:PAT family beta-lactamase induction signal transducer AmpG